MESVRYRPNGVLAVITEGNPNEPSTMILLGSGLLDLVGFGRKAATRSLAGG